MVHTCFPVHSVTVLAGKFIFEFTIKPILMYMEFWTELSKTENRLRRLHLMSGAARNYLLIFKFLILLLTELLFTSD